MNLNIIFSLGCYQNRKLVNNILVLVGKTASGKDTICNELLERGFKKLVTYTTRPMRSGEVDGVTYHYISKDKFLELLENGFFLEYAYYDVANGERWYYASALEDYKDADDKTVAILNPYGVKRLQKLNIQNITYVYIYANLSTIRNRLEKRGDNKYEADRRIEADNRDFKDMERDVDKVIYNNSGCRIDDIVFKILKTLGED